MTNKAGVIVPFRDQHLGIMRIIALSTLKAFWKENPECQNSKELIVA